MDVLPLLAAASLIAGWVDAVIGGGGLVLIPVLLATTGMPPAAALATNKVASVSGTASAAVTLVRRVGVPRFSWAYALVAGVLSACGALAVSLISDAAIRPLILILLLAVGTFVAVNPSFGTRTGKPVFTPLRLAGGFLLAAAIGFYDGIFGPGTGMFLIMGFSALFSQAFVTSAALAKVVNTATNTGALVVFIAAGWVNWPLALSLALANIVGAQLGARTVLKGGSRLVRFALLGLVVVLCLRLGILQYLSF